MNLEKLPPEAQRYIRQQRVKWLSERGWKLSAKGNLTKRVRGYWCTCIKEPEGYRTCVGGHGARYADSLYSSLADAKEALLLQLTAVLYGVHFLEPTPKGEVLPKYRPRVHRLPGDVPLKQHSNSAS